MMYGRVNCVSLRLENERACMQSAQCCVQQQQRDELCAWIEGQWIGDEETHTHTARTKRQHTRSGQHMIVVYEQFFLRVCCCPIWVHHWPCRHSVILVFLSLLLYGCLHRKFSLLPLLLPSDRCIAVFSYRIHIHMRAPLSISSAHPALNTHIRTRTHLHVRHSDTDRNRYKPEHMKQTIRPSAPNELQKKKKTAYR